jgi:hypothetical protein
MAPEYTSDPGEPKVVRRGAANPPDSFNSIPVVHSRALAATRRRGGAEAGSNANARPWEVREPE